MATITLNYDARNKNINMLLDVIRNLGAVTTNTSQKKGLEEALEDVKKGRIYKAKNAKDVIMQCLQ